MTKPISNERYESVINFIESEIFQAPDRELLATAEQRDFAAEASRVVSSVLATYQTRRKTTQAAVRRPDRRAAVQQLLVASRRARDIAGSAHIASLTEAEFDELLTKLADHRLFPKDA